MSAESSPRRPDGAAPGPELSALEQALRRALDTVPSGEVVKCIVSMLPVAVLAEESAQSHGGKVRKVSVSMPEELAEAVRTRTGSGGFSRYVTTAVQERVRLDLLDDLAAEIQTEFGPFDEDGVRQAMRLWPDFEEEA